LKTAALDNEGIRNRNSSSHKEVKNYRASYWSSKRNGKERYWEVRELKIRKDGEEGGAVSLLLKFTAGTDDETGEGPGEALRVGIGRLAGGNFLEERKENGDLGGATGRVR